MDNHSDVEKILDKLERLSGELHSFQLEMTRLTAEVGATLKNVVETQSQQRGDLSEVFARLKALEQEQPGRRLTELEKREAEGEKELTGLKIKLILIGAGAGVGGGFLSDLVAVLTGAK